MIKYIKYMFMGIIIGVAKIIPGVSGAVIAISFGVYDLGIDAITHFFHNKKRNFLFLTSLGLGIFIGIILFSNIVKYLIDNYYLMVMLLFTGLILGGTINISKNIKKDKVCYIVMTLSLIIIVLLGVNNIDNSYVIKSNFSDYIVYFGSGFVEAIGTVVPGISSTALLMIIGIYDIFISSIADIYSISNVMFLLPFSLGLGLGIIIVAYIMDYLFKKYKDKMFAFIIGISFGSVVLMLFKSFINGFIIYHLIIGIMLFIIGFLVCYFFDKFN